MTIARIKTWTAGEVLFANDLNAEFDNLIPAINGATNITATGTSAARNTSDRWAEYVNVKDFGALGDDSTDDTGAIQAAFDYAVSLLAATVVFPRGTYRHTGLTLSPSSGQVHINLLGLGGSGSNGVRLKYTGTGGVALTIVNNTRYFIDNLRVLDAGTGLIGMHFTSLSTGSNHGPATIQNCVVTGFDTNVQIGTDANLAASELTFLNLEVTQATTGVLIQGPTSGTSFSSNIRFISFQASFCTTTLVTAGDNSNGNVTVFVWGFSFSFCDTDFDLQVPGMYRISSGITENSGDETFLKSGSETATENSAVVTHVVLDSCYLNITSSPSNRIIQLNQPGHYSIRDSLIQTGSIILGGYDGGAGPRKGSLIVENTSILSVDDPVVYRASSNTIWSVRMLGTGSAQSETINQYEDRHYIVDTSGDEFNIAKYGAWSASAGGDALNAALGTRVVATADLPAASSDMDGTMIIEDAGTGDRNLILYAGGERFRINGGANV